LATWATRLLLFGAVLVPLLYFGIQLALAPFHPGYDFRTDVASLLGARGAPGATFFNLAAALSGVAAIAGALGLWRSLAAAAPLWVRLLLALAIVGLGFGNIWAGVYPLPDPRHSANPFAPAFFVMPLLLCVSCWFAPGLRDLRAPLSLNFLAFCAYGVVMAGLTSVDLGANIGWLQRFGALTIMGAIGFVGYYRLRREAPVPA
jgi:glucans biosynthesis protein C